MNFNNLAKAHVRTVVPYIVGVIISLALRAGIDLHGYTPELTVIVGSAYYAAARIAEEYVSPKFGWLLGVAASPQYVRQASGRTKLPKGPADSHLTVKIHADTTAFMADLKAVEAQAKKAAAAIAKVKKA